MANSSMQVLVRSHYVNRVLSCSHWFSHHFNLDAQEHKASVAWPLTLVRFPLPYPLHTAALRRPSLLLDTPSFPAPTSLLSLVSQPVMLSSNSAFERFSSVGGWMVSPQKICPHSNTRNLWLVPYMAKDTIKFKTLRSLPCTVLFTWALHTISAVLIKGAKRQWTHRREGSVSREAESGVMCPQPRTASSQEKARNRFSPRTSAGCALLAPHCWASGLQNCERINSCCFSHQGCSNLIQQP